MQIPCHRLPFTLTFPTPIVSFVFTRLPWLSPCDTPRPVHRARPRRSRRAVVRPWPAYLASPVPRRRPWPCQAPVAPPPPMTRLVRRSSRRHRSASARSVPSARRGSASASSALARDGPLPCLQTRSQVPPSTPLLHHLHTATPHRFVRCLVPA